MTAENGPASVLISGITTPSLNERLSWWFDRQPDLPAPGAFG
jgi:hypothetical protein